MPNPLGTLVVIEFSGSVLTYSRDVLLVYTNIKGARPGAREVFDNIFFQLDVTVGKSRYTLANKEVFHICNETRTYKHLRYLFCISIRQTEQ